jgi:NDP-mannose synthase
MSKRAVILAGGRGTRLRPYTAVLPKPLMPVGDYSILEIIIRQLVSHGFTHITMAVNHQADIIQALYGDGSKWKIKIDYSLENRPLSTMGPLKLISDLPENFMVMNGDILTDLNYSNFFDKHVTGKDIFSISSYTREHKVDYGVLRTNTNNNLTGFEEKPVFSFCVSMGIYMVNRKVLVYIPENEPFGFDNLMLKLISEKLKVTVRNHSGYWLDIGRPDDYIKAIDEFDELKNQFLPNG